MSDLKRFPDLDMTGYPDIDLDRLKAEIFKLRAENERLRVLLSGWLELSESHPIGLEVVDRGHVTKDVCRYNPDVVLKYLEAIARTREALKEGKP